MRSFLLGAEREGAFNIPFKVERDGGWTNPWVRDGAVAIYDAAYSGSVNGEWICHGEMSSAVVTSGSFTRTSAGILAGSDDCVMSVADFAALEDGVANVIDTDSGGFTVEYCIDCTNWLGWASPVDTRPAIINSLGAELNTRFPRLNSKILLIPSRVFRVDVSGMFTDTVSQTYTNSLVYQVSTVFTPMSRRTVANSPSGIMSAEFAWTDSSFYGRLKSGGDLHSRFVVGGNLTVTIPRGCTMQSMRFYNRALTDAEIAANYAVDKARFNLS